MKDLNNNTKEDSEPIHVDTNTKSSNEDEPVVLTDQQETQERYSSIWNK